MIFSEWLPVLRFLSQIFVLGTLSIGWSYCSSQSCARKTQKPIHNNHWRYPARFYGADPRGRAGFYGITDFQTKWVHCNSCVSVILLVIRTENSLSGLCMRKDFHWPNKNNFFVTELISVQNSQVDFLCQTFDCDDVPIQSFRHLSSSQIAETLQ